MSRKAGSTFIRMNLFFPPQKMCRKGKRVKKPKNAKVARKKNFTGSP